MKSNTGDRRPRPAPGIRITLDPERIAIEALGFLAAEPERLDRFLALTGLAPASLRTAAGEPGFAQAVLSYVASDDALLVAFAQATGHDPEAIGQLVHAVVEGGPGDGGG